MTLNFDIALYDYLPDWFKPILEYQAICATETQQLQAITAAIAQIADNCFFQTMDLGTVQLWEQALGIVADPQTEDLAFRRVRVLNRISTRPPFTLGFLQQKLDELIGPGKWEVNVDYPNYTLYVKSSAINQQYAQEVAVTIGQIKPAHIVYINQPYLSASLLLDEQVELAELVYNYHLGAWGLGVNPFATTNSLEVIVTPDQRSIQQGLVDDTATAVSADVASARINGTTVISGLTKTANGGVVTISYTVTPDDATTVTQVELLNADGDQLTSAPVYVPISSDTVFSHTITVEEANT